MALNDDLLKILEELLEQSDNDYDVVLNQYKGSKEKVKQLLASLYMDYAEDGVIDYNQVYLTGVMSQFEEQLDQELNTISTFEVVTITAILGAAFTESYYRSAYTLEQNIGVGINFERENQSVLDSFINQDWSGAHFSERIWRNQQALKEALSTNLERGIREGHKLEKIAKVFDEQFDSKAYQSQRLVRTETAHIITESREKVYEENGIQQVQWLATLEANTCADCADLDGQIFDLNDSIRPVVPYHPNCKCDIVPVIEGGTNIRRDNETRENIPYQTYEEWAKANQFG
ncbi:minor capsid protein [Halalkalibacter krulwichiae]|uniref:NAD(+)--arginine ADP-ribosyltransferase EFV n=1 Tax=Halalkalibacter krulwichiae TaxID=199441 RepID=A0A1X9MBH9_9BACI|nr:minor capsid protein [Halalkalibacter krulwichiae]ARK30777.1 NAD(+)--arginine ADP-ribosyltransferase EFV [Halalkalibacter krulwichiae]